jgi:cytochrome c oxidase subunit II
MSRLAAPPRRRALPRAALPLFLALVALLAGCGMIPPEPETTQAKEVFSLYLIVLAMGFVVFVGVEGFIVYSIIRYRRRDDRLPTQVHGNNTIEMVWTVIPTVIVLVLFVLSMITLSSIDARAVHPGVTIEVDAFQWQWTFHYLDGDANPNNDVSITGTPASPAVMTLPVGEPIRLILRSSDVIHAFYVPHFLVKRDVIPVGEGRTPNELEFTVTSAGTYAGQCAEFCGDLHSQMTFSVHAVSPADFDAWYAAARAKVTASKPPAPSASPGGTVLKVTAAGIAYDIHQLTVPAGQAFSIEFTNKDTIPHNIGIYQGKTELFRGDVVIGPGAATYQVPALQAGDYTYVCDYHPGVPAMTGTLTVK